MDAWEKLLIDEWEGFYLPHLEDSIRNGDFKMAEFIITAKGPMYRIVRSQRMYKGVLVGAIHDKGWLVMVRCDGGAWTPIHAIRKLK